jgi:hypothetical protein
MKSLICLVAIPLLATVSLAAEISPRTVVAGKSGEKTNKTQTSSQYTSRRTSILSKDCSKLPKQMSISLEKLGLYGDECPAPSEWRLYVIVGGDRSWVDIAHNESLWTTEQEVVYRKENFFGFFPNITSKRVEWRINEKGTPSALIFPITAQNPEQPDTNITRFFVISLRDRVPFFCGTARTDDEARVIADKPAACTRVLPKRPV